MRWFRLYDDTINDPKILKLPEALRWHWIAMLCIASKSEGALPPLDDIAIQLRVTTGKATEVMAALVKAGLLDKTETGFTPHNWNGRQYKSDVSTERVKRFRNGKRNVSVTPPDTETETEDRIGDAGASMSAFTEGSKVLASTFWKALGFDSPLAVPPEFAGVDWRAIEWERAGWTADLIDAETRRNAGKPLSYHEKCFATAFAKRQAPLPIVEVREAETIKVTRHGTNQKPGVVEVARRWAEQFEGQSSDGGEGDSVSLLGLPAR